MLPDNITRIGNYDVVALVGEGGMGKVYKGVDPRIGRPVAIKLMSADFSKNEEALRRFYREAQSVGVLQHPNIVVVYDLGDQDGVPFLIMEYLEGESLDRIIASRRELSIVEKLQITSKVLHALNYAHQRRIVHRDVKPGNVMVAPDGDCKLVDFGIARMGDANLTHTGQIVGSMNYMSPEQLNGYEVDGRTDIWSAAVMFYQLLTFHLPFEGRDMAQLIVKILSENPPPLSTYLTGYYPPELDDIIARALNRDRDARYLTADEFAFDLEHVEHVLKAQMVSEYVEQARASLDTDLTRAKELLARVLKVDTQNATAKQMLFQVQQMMHQQQKADQVHGLRARAEEALAGGKWEDALNLVDQALKLDQTNLELLGLRESVLQKKSRKEQVSKLIHLAEAAQKAGEFDMARRAVDDAMSIDPNDTQARVLNTALVREIEQRERFQQLLKSVRSEVSASRFEDAARMLREAEALSPQATEIMPLKNLIAAGREEQLRAERFTVLRAEAEQFLAKQQFVQAQGKAEEALRYDSSNRSMMELLERIKTEQQNHWVAQQLTSADKLVAEGRITAALSLIETAASQFRDQRLQARIPDLRQRLEAQRRSSSLNASLAAARAAAEKGEHDSAVSILERASTEHGPNTEINQLLVVERAAIANATRARRINEAVQNANRLIAQQNEHAAEALLEESMAGGLDDANVTSLLEQLRARRKEREVAASRSAEEQAAQQAAMQSAAEAAAIRAAEDARRAEQDAARIAAEREAQRQTAEREAAARAEREAAAKAAEAEAQRQTAEREARAKAEREAAAKAAAAATPAPAEKPSKLSKKERARLDEALKKARTLISRNSPADAVTLLEALPTSLREGEAEQLLQEARASMAAASRAVAEPPAPPPDNFSATSLFSSPVNTAPPPPPAYEAPVAPPPPPPPAPPAPVKGKDKEPAPKKIAPPAPPATPGEQPPAKSNKGMLIGVAAAVLVVVIGAVVFLTKKPSTPGAGPGPSPSGVVLPISFETSPAGAEISAEGNTCKAPCSLNLAQGDHNVKASLPGYDAVQKQVSVGSTPQTIAFTLNAVQVALSKLDVQTSEDGVDLLIDGVLKGVTKGKKITLNLVPGSYKLRAEKAGFEPAEQTVSVSASGSSAQFKLNKAAGPVQPVRDPYLMISARAGSKVVIDGHQDFNVPSDGTGSLQIKPGRHHIDVSLPGFQPWSTDVNANAGDTVSVHAEMKEIPKPPASVVSFSASNPNIQAGQSVELRWQTLNARDVNISGIGSVPASGSRQVTPSASTSYTLTAHGEGPAASSTVNVNVAAKAAAASIDLFDTGADAVQSGQSTKLTWVTSNATEVTIDPGIGAVPAKGSKQVTPSQTTTYTLTARSAGGTDQRTVKVAVSAAPPPPPTENPDIKLVKEAIEVRYREAYESGDIREVQKVWPSMSKQVHDALAAGMKQFTNLQAHYQCNTPSIQGDSATCTCKESIAFTIEHKRTQGPSGNFVFELKKSGGVWYVQNRRVQ